MQVLELLKDIEKRFNDAGFDTPRLDARIIVSFYLGRQASEIVMFFSQDVIIEQLDRINIAVARRLSGEPVSRIIGSRDFWKLSFLINEDTLDPRPDSETLIEAVLSSLADVKSDTEDQKIRILDLGTGSGCLLLSLLYEIPNAYGVGVDISLKAVEQAKLNLKRNNLEGRAEFVCSDWKELDFTKSGSFDVVISNPPYIPSADIEGLDNEVKNYDPKRALDGGKDGLDAYRQISLLLPKVLKKNGNFFCEIGINQRKSVDEIFENAGFASAKVFKDLAGIERVLHKIWAKNKK